MGIVHVNETTISQHIEQDVLKKCALLNTFYKKTVKIWS